MKWLSSKTEYEGLPLYLRLPNYQNIYRFKPKYQQLVCITHKLDIVKSNGLPTSGYNELLIDFDTEVVSLFDFDKNGIIFLVETYGGERNYWFYLIDTDSHLKTFDNLKNKYSKKRLAIESRNDLDWEFIKDYPVELFKLK